MDKLLADSAQLIKRRRAFLLGLQSLLTHDEALGALCLWERDYCDGVSPFTGLLLYCREICERFGKAGRRKELHAALLEALFLPEAALPPDPSDEMRELESKVRLVVPDSDAVAVEPPEPVAVEVPALNITLGLLLRCVLAELEKYRVEEGANCLRFVNEVIGQLGLPDSVNRAIVRSMRAAASVPLYGTIPARQAANLVHVIYVWIAETQGPVVADRVLSTAVQEVERTEEAAGFSVRQLL